MKSELGLVIIASVGNNMNPNQLRKLVDYYPATRRAPIGALAFACAAIFLSGCRDSDSDDVSCAENTVNADSCVASSNRYVTAIRGTDVLGPAGSLQATIPLGYYDGTTTATMTDPNLIAANIIAGTTIFGIAGAAPTAACTDGALNASACVTAASRYVTGTPGVAFNGLNGMLTTNVPAGYYSGSTSVTMSDTALVPSNIASGVTIFGVAGTLPSTPVGACMGGGVVFYVNSDPNAPAGQRGLIAAPTDALSSAAMAWQSGGSTTVIPTPQKTYYTGEANTNAILSTIGIFPAASAANSYTVNGDTCTECTSWYLPSQNELATLYAVSTSSIALGNTTFWSACSGSSPAATSYWSSTQGTLNSQAYSVNFLTGIVTTSTNSNSFRVRAVRAF